jgi:hypothetical protein
MIRTPFTWTFEAQEIRPIVVRRIRLHIEYSTMRHRFGDSPDPLLDLQFTRDGFALPPYSHKGAEA